MIGAQQVFTVSELNRSAREFLESRFGEIWVKGEISELKRAPSGHVYFTLKDKDSELSAVRFRSRSALVADAGVETGTVVLAFGKLTIYEPRGRYQFVASLLQPVAAGALQLAFERLKKKLLEEGLFAEEHKRPLPTYPERIGVVTSPSGAALRDVVSILERRWPTASIVLFPSSVQGDAAPSELQAAVERAVRFSAEVLPLDVLILGRGGGSAEDLAAFNDENLARAVFACPIPVISAVGHETDVSIVDFVADRRAPTPSAAAELVVPNRAEIVAGVDAAAVRMHRAAAARLRLQRTSLRSQLRSYLFRVPQRLLETLEQRLDLQVAAAWRGVAAVWTSRQRAAQRAEELLRLSDPGLPLRRGYSLTFIAGSDRRLRTAADVSVGGEIETRLGAGQLRSRIEEVKPK
jgi:exodeoxyribonuclease VII large subunit